MDLGEFRNNLAEFVRTERHKQRLSQSDLAAMVGVTQSAVTKYETGKWPVSVDLAVRLLNVLGYDVELEIVKAKPAPVEVRAPAAQTPTTVAEAPDATESGRMWKWTQEAYAQGITELNELNAFLMAKRKAHG